MSIQERKSEFSEYSTSLDESAQSSPKTMFTEEVEEEDNTYDKMTFHKANSNAFCLHMFFKPSDIPLLIIGVISAMLNSLAPVAVTILLGRLFQKLADFLAGDYSSTGSFINDLKFAAFAITIVGVGSFIFNWISIFCFMEFGEQQQIRCRRFIFNTLLKKKFSWFDETSELNGSLVQINRCVEEYRGSVSECLSLFLTDIFTVVSLLVTSFIYSWKLTLIAIAGFPLIVLSGTLLSMLIDRYTRQENNFTSEAAKIVDWNLTSFQWVKLVNGQLLEINKFSGKVDQCATAFIRLRLFTCLNLGIIKGLSLMMFVQSFWFGSFLVNKGLSSTGAVMSCFYACLSCTMLFSGISQNIVLLQKGNIALRQVLDFVGDGEALPCVNDDKVESIDLDKSKVQGDIEFNNINFAYPFRKDVQVLKNINISVPKNKTTYIVGKSGSGKSTLSNLLLRFYQNPNETSSSITLDGININDIEQSSLTDIITLVQQSSVVFSGTLRENIEFGAQVSETVSPQLLEEAIKLSQLEDTIRSFPNGLNTFVKMGGESLSGGKRNKEKVNSNEPQSVILSGGQQQRVAIARARVRDTPILILDEATSALDKTTRERVLAGIKRWRKDKTTIIMTHEFSQIENDDLVYVLKDGMVVEKGLKKDLLDMESGNFNLMNKYNFNLEEFKEGQDSEKLEFVSHGNENKYHLRPTKSITSKVSSILDIPTVRGGEANDIEKQLEIAKVESRDTRLMGIWMLLNYYKTEILSSWFPLTLGILVSILNAACNPVFSYCFARLINGIIPTAESSNGSVLQWSLTVTGIAIFDGFTLFISKFLMGYVSEIMICSIRKKTFTKIMRQNSSWFNQHQMNAEITALLLNDARDLRHVISEFLIIIINVVVMVMIGMIWAIICGWKLALVGLSFVPAFLFVGILYSWLLERAEDKYKTSVSGIENEVYECLTGIKTVLCLNLKNHFTQKFQDRIEKCNNVGLSRANIVGFGVSLPNVLMYLAESVLLFYGLKLIAQGHYSLVQVMEVFTLMLFSMSNALSLLTSSPDIAKGQRVGTYLANILDSSEADTEFRGYAKPEFDLDKGDCLIRFENLNYSYDQTDKSDVAPHNLVLQEVNFELRNGETLAVVGESGSGKSTLVSLLLRLYKFHATKTSQINFLGYNIGDWDVEYLRDQIAVVPQTAVFFEGSIFDNLTYSLPPRLEFNDNLLQTRVWEVLELVDLKDFVMSLPDKLSSRVGDATNTLVSGGQAQRLSIARAIIREPKLIIFDEATSALDPDNSKRIREFITDTLSKDDSITVIMVTHAVEMMKIADTIVHLNKGFCEVGSFDELMEMHGEFEKLVRFTA